MNRKLNRKWNLETPHKFWMLYFTILLIPPVVMYLLSIAPMIRENQMFLSIRHIWTNVGVGFAVLGIIVCAGYFQARNERIAKGGRQRKDGTPVYRTKLDAKEVQEVLRATDMTQTNR